MYGCSKMILLGSGEDFIYNHTSTGSDVIMTSNFIFDIMFFFIHTVENITDIKRKKKISSFRACSDLHVQKIRL